MTKNDKKLTVTLRLDADEARCIVEALDNAGKEAWRDGAYVRPDAIDNEYVATMFWRAAGAICDAAMSGREEV